MADQNGIPLKVAWGTSYSKGLAITTARGLAWSSKIAISCLAMHCLAVAVVRQDLNDAAILDLTLGALLHHALHLPA